MSNDEIGTLLNKYILNDNTKEFKKLLKHCKALENELDLNYIINENLYDDVNYPLIVTAANRNNLDIIDDLIKHNVCKCLISCFNILFAYVFYNFYHILCNIIGKCKFC